MYKRQNMPKRLSGTITAAGTGAGLRNKNGKKMNK
jgi:hypothetical protein